MTLTLKTAKHAIDKYGKIYDIGDEGDILDDYSMARDEAEDISEYDPRFKPCIVVTTAREALEAAWELAHPTPETTTTIQTGTPFITRGPKGIITMSKGCDFTIEANKDGETELRTLTPLPEPEPEPWETSRYCYAGGLFHERREDEHGTFWLTVEDNPGTYDRAELAKHNPRPVTIG